MARTYGIVRRPRSPTPPLKRARTDSSSSEFERPSPERTPSPEPASSSELPYFADKPQHCKECADVVLVLDSGEHLPVHSSHLLAQSAVLGDMISTNDEKGKGKRPPSQCRELPLPDTTFKEACHFLVALYDFHGKHTLTTETLPSITKIAHKFAMHKILEICDQRFSRLAGYNGCSIKLWTSEQPSSIGAGDGMGKCLEFLHFAERYGLPKLEASCERFLARNFDSLHDHPLAADISVGSLRRMMRAASMGINGLRMACHERGACRSGVKTKLPVNGETECPQCDTSLFYGESHSVLYAFNLPPAAEMEAWAREDAGAV